jgi:diguanylate cyclase (GGDEF)-like protein/PAS domain S-box-containing protein
MPPFHDPAIYRDILDGLQIGVSVLDLNKKIVFWSDGAEKITGYARIDVLGHSCAENILLHCNHDSCDVCSGTCPMAASLHDGKPVEAMTFVHHRAGHWTPVHTWAIPLRDEHGLIVGIIQTFESEFSVYGPNPNDRSMKERGCLDFATELPNQALMQSHLRETLGTFAEFHIPFAVAFLEVQKLDHFRARYGQEAATSMLRVLARTLKNSVWPADFVGRWSDDRLLVILNGCDANALQAVIERIRQMAASATIEWWGEELSAMILVEGSSAAADDTVESLLLRAHNALRGDRSTAAAAGSPSSSAS